MDGAWLVSTDAGGAAPALDWSAAEAALAGVRDGSTEFVVIEREKDSDTLFFQASAWTRGVVLGRSFVAEARFPDGDGFRQMMLRTKRFDEVLESAMAFMSGSEDLVGRWTDVTDDYLGRQAS